jgi:hypothetical protein
MESIKKIQKRIKMRQGNVNNFNNEGEETPKTEKPITFKYLLYKFCMNVMVVMSLLLGLLIYARKDEKATFIKEKFGYSLDFTYINNLADGVVKKILDYDIFKGLKGDDSEVVDAIPTYQILSGNRFTNDDGKTYSISSGKVAYVGEGLQGQKMIIVKTIHNIVITYVGLIDTFVYENDWVDNNDVIASFEGEIMMYFTRQGESLTYEEVVSIID